MRKIIALLVAITMPSGAVVAQTADWSGAYIGAQIGFADADSSLPGSSGDGIIAGIVGGYDWDLGAWVVGLGADYDVTDVGLGPTANLEEVFRIKFRGGYKIGQGLAYGTAGYASADTDVLGDEDGYFIGAGYEHRLTPGFSLGGEVLYHEFDNLSTTPTDVDTTTVQVRGTFRF